MMRNCRDCVHNPICQLWRNAECQDAGCYSDDCFQRKQPEKSADQMFRELGYCQNPDTPNCYEHAEEDSTITLEDDCVCFDEEGCVFRVGIAQVLACGQLIREMEALNESA